MYQPWKFLIYIAADNVLYENAQVSLREITDSSLLSDVEIIAQIDGPTAAMATRYKCEKGSKRLTWVAPEHYPADRGDRLRDFLNAAAANINPHQRILLVLWGEGWHRGVVGIVASRVVEKFHRPRARGLEGIGGAVA